VRVTFEVVASLDQRQGSQIFSVEVEQIECDKDARRFSQEQILEDWPAFSINAGDLPIEHGGFNLQVFSDPGGEFSESTEDVSVARDQFTFAVLNGSQCAKPVDLQFEEIPRSRKVRDGGKAEWGEGFAALRRL
jgi:hypothetical protein